MPANNIKNDFPLFRSQKDPIIYLDNASTTQKPVAVIERLSHYYTCENANIHRGQYPLSLKLESMYEHARASICKWFKAEEGYELIFTSGSTAAVNITASLLFENMLTKEDNIIVSELEHSSNFYPWKFQCGRSRVKFRAAPAEPDGSLNTDSILSLIDSRTKLIAVTAMSNVTGFCPDLNAITAAAHEQGILVFVDGAQASAHQMIDLCNNDWDFFCFSSHKIYGPMGIGGLFIKKELAETFSPCIFGGGMLTPGANGQIQCRHGPEKFEAGTQNIAGILGMETAFSYLGSKNFPRLLDQEIHLSAYARLQLSSIPWIRLCGPDIPSPVISFESKKLGSYDIGVLLARHGIAIRCGAHCAYPLLKRMGRESLCRISLAIYNTKADIDLLIDVLDQTGRNMML